MKVKIEIISKQIIDEKEEQIIQNGIGEINKFEKGSLLVWDIPKEKLHCQMTILHNKILLKKQNQNMVFELSRTTNSILQTQYGVLNMNITTKNIEISTKNGNINYIKLEYEIEIQDYKKYKNMVEIKIKNFM
jgi:uncharacterized beta-barrel protein YwiB (DUF1934 family)